MAIASSISFALSGALAGERRVATSAGNLANLRSVAAPSASGEQTGPAGDPLFRPTRAIDQSGPVGGVRSTNLVVNPSAVQEYDPSAPDAGPDGLVYRPNVDIARETTEQISGQRQFEANLATVRAADDLLRSTIDIKS